MPPTIPRWLYPCILLTALLSLYSISFRYSVEEKNKAVSIVAEFDVVQEFAAGQGVPTQGAFQQLKNKGLLGVVLTEEYMSDLIALGHIEVKPIATGSLVTGSDDVLARAVKGLQIRYPNVQIRPHEGGGVEVDLPTTLTRKVPMGLSPGQADLAKSVGLQIISRHNNPQGGTSGYVGQTVTWAKEMGSEAFMPTGDQVLGRRDSLQALQEAIQENRMIYITPEFSKIGGDEQMVQLAPELVVRMHPAQAADLDKLPYTEAVDRYVRAAEERGEYYLLVRPVKLSAEKPLTELVTFVDDIKKGVESGGYSMAKPHPYGKPEIPRWLFVLIGLVVAPVIWWTATVFVQNTGIRIVGAALLALLVLGCYVKNGREYMALFAAIALPLASFITLDARKPKRWPLEILIVSAISLVGGLVVAGLLNDLPYYVRADQFSGVKLAHFLPIGLVGLYYFRRFTNVGEALNTPVKWLQAATAIFILAALAFMFTRTGNDNPAGVSGFELKIRDLLDTILVVRPRTKEFMIGHPALVVGIGLLSLAYWRSRMTGKGWIPLLMMIAAIGQTSIVNTMCHLHTPVVLSLTRIGVGLLAGGILGGILWAIVMRFQPREEG
jgi:hypothetical protein